MTAPTPMIVPVKRHIESHLLDINPANGYVYTITADQILGIKKDLTVDGSAAGPNCCVYVTGFGKMQPGQDANFGQILAIVHFALDFAINVQEEPDVEVLQAAADFERNIKQDYSQGSTCKNTTSPDLLLFGFDMSGWFHGSLTWDCLVPWGENDPYHEFSTTYN